MTRNLATYIAADIADTRPALVYDNGDQPPDTLSYGEVRQQIRNAAAALLSTGVRKGDRVAIIAGNHKRYFIAFYAVMHMGAVACPVNVRLTADVKAKVLSLCNADFAFVDSDHCETANITMLSLDDDDVFSGSKYTPPCAVDGDDLACIMFTSGSSGVPKAVPITHAGYGWALRHYDFARDASQDLRTLIVAPFFHMNAQATTMLALYFGGTSILMNSFDAETFLDAIARHKVSELTGVPTILELAIRKLEAGYHADISSVTTIAIGSAPMSENLLHRIRDTFKGASFDNGYGTTEGGLVSFGPAPEGKTKPPLSIGYAARDVEFFLEGSDDEGVLWIKTPMTTKGYIGLPDANAEKFKDGFYNTGDILRRDSDGFYFFVGRADDMFVCAGENIYPTEVETVLRNHPAVSEAIIVPRADQIKGQVPVAFVTLNKDKTTTEAALKTYTLERLPAYAHPRSVIFLDEMPRGTTEKIDRKDLMHRAQTTGLVSA